MKDERALRRLAKKGILSLVGDVKEEKLAELKKLLVMMQLEGRKEAKLVIDTNGGEGANALMFADAVALLSLELTGLVVGKCYSAGIIILQACHKRLATPHSRFLIHFGSGSGHFTYRGDDEEFTRLFQTVLASAKDFLASHVAHIARRSGLTSERVLELMRNGDKNDRFLSAAEALEFNFIDEIVTDFKLPL